MKKLLLAAVALTISGTAVAQNSPAPPPPRRDLPTTRAEAIAKADRMFAAMDTNRDGKVSADERRAFREARRERRGGGRELTQAQFRERALHRFDRIDTNHDGKIDAKEREAARLLMRSRMAGRDGPMGG